MKKMLVVYYFWSNGNTERIEENLNIWDFTLSNEDMAAVGALDLEHSEIIDHSAAETAKWLNGWKIHD